MTRSTARHTRPANISTTAVVGLALVALGAAAPATAGSAPSAAKASRQVVVEAADPFVDPTARLVRRAEVTLEESVYVGPFATLDASGGPIDIGPESNTQDSVSIRAAVARSRADARRIRRLGLHADSGVETGERVILAHGSSVRGPARLGVGAASEDDSGVFVSFGAQVDGAIIERDAGVSALGRVGPGVRLRSGLLVLPGKNVTTQEQADNPDLGKVRPITEADRAFNAGVVEVNVGLARAYNQLQDDDPSAVRGINLDPGGNVFDQTRDAPRFESALCAGPDIRKPASHNRVVGDVCFEDDLHTVERRLGDRVSLRADEGGPFSVGRIDRMGDGTVFHALEGSDLAVGNDVRYGKGVIVHGGGRPSVNPTTGLADPTVIGNRVRLGDGAVVFRSFLRNGARVGDRSAVIASELAVGQVVPPRTIYANNVVFGPVEW